MWIVLNDAFLSVVKHRRPDMVLVRARKENDLHNVFPNAKITETPDRDYQFRCVVSRRAMKKALAAEVDRIDYDNFKNSVEDDERHDAYSAIWSTMFSWARGGFAKKAVPRWTPGPRFTTDPNAELEVESWRKGEPKP